MFTKYNLKNIKLIEQCLKFIEEVLDDREWSHGIEHSKQVAINSLEIWFNGENEKYNEISNKTFLEVEPITVVIFSALLHDVMDHKYVKYMPMNIGANLEELIDITGKNSAKIINQIIKNISYSSEITNGLCQLPEDVQCLRHIVSDADKLEALGEIGIQRTIAYQHETSSGKTDEQIIEMAKSYIKEKLSFIYPDFLHTEYGLKVGKERTVVMKKMIE